MDQGVCVCVWASWVRITLPANWSWTFSEWTRFCHIQCWRFLQASRWPLPCYFFSGRRGRVYGDDNNQNFAANINAPKKSMEPLDSVFFQSERKLLSRCQGSDIFYENLSKWIVFEVYMSRWGGAVPSLVGAEFQGHVLLREQCVDSIPASFFVLRRPWNAVLAVRGAAFRD